MSVPASAVAWVAGATGYTGREVVARACALGRRVHAHVRPDSPSLEAHRERFTAAGAIVETTPWEREALAARLAEVRPTEVYALLGTTQARARAAAKAGAPAADYAAVDVGMTLMLHRACDDAGLRPRFVYLSALGAQARASTAYMRARWEVEEALRAGPLPYTIVRPSFITGPDREERRLGERVGATVSDALLGLVRAFGGATISDRFRSIDAASLARALVDLAVDPAAVGAVVEADALRG
ncbi:MAG: NAD(P)H-binding protein [Nannocystaceae bacterium]